MRRIYPFSAAGSSVLAGAANVDARHGAFIQVGRDNVTYVNNASEAKETLSALKPVDRSGYYVQPCMEGTRKNILEEIDAWVEDFRAPNTLWIKGSPGSGKSTI